MQSYSELLVRSCVQSSDPPHGFLQPQTCGAHWRTNHQPTIRTYVQRELIWFEASEQARKRVGCARMRLTCLKHAGLGFQHSGAIGPKTSRAFKFGLKTWTYGLCQTGSPQVNWTRWSLLVAMVTNSKPPNLQIMNSKMANIKLVASKARFYFPFYNSTVSIKIPGDRKGRREEVQFIYIHHKDKARGRSF